MSPLASLDLSNAFFEGVGAILTWTNVMRIRRDREVKGIDWRVTAFWSAWGVWNVGYYDSVGHPLSMWAGAFLAAGNVCWVLHAVHYTRRRAEQRIQNMRVLAEYRARSSPPGPKSAA